MSTMSTWAKSDYWLLGQVRIQSWHHPHTVCSQWRSTETDPMPVARLLPTGSTLTLPPAAHLHIPFSWKKKKKKKKYDFPGKKQVCVWLTLPSLLSWITLLWTNTSHACIQAKKEEKPDFESKRQLLFGTIVILETFWRQISAASKML